MLRTLLIFILCLLSGCIYTYTPAARKAYLAACDTGVNLFNLKGEVTGMTRAEVYDMIGKPVKAFETISPNTGQAIIVEEYTYLDTYMKESDILKNMYGTPERIKRTDCVYFYLVYAPTDGKVLGRSYQRNGNWTRRKESIDWYVVRRKDGSLPDMFVY